MNTEDFEHRGLIFTGRHLPYNPRLIERAKELRKNMTSAEKKLWIGFLRQFRYRFRPQRPIDNYIVDFYCASLKCVIEIDGEHHCTEEGKIYDSEREGILEYYGLTVIRFTNREITEDFDTVCRKIEKLAQRQ